MATPRRTEPAPRNKPGETIGWARRTAALPPTTECILFPYQPGRKWPSVNLNGITETLGSCMLILSGQPRPTGMIACHLPDICNNGRCANVAHIRWDTPDANKADMHIAGTINDIRGERNKFASLTEAQVVEIKALLTDGGATNRAIADIYDVHQVTIHNIGSGRSWAHIPWPDGTYKRYQPTGHPRNAKLDEAKVAEIKALLLDPARPTLSVIADSYGVSRNTISVIKSNRSWRHVPWPEPTLFEMT